MTTCRWCSAEIHLDIGEECVSCWALRTRIEKHPAIAQKMIKEIFCNEESTSYEDKEI